MSISTAATSDAALAARLLREGYGTGAWHGPDLRAAIADVSTPLAFRRPAPGRHNIAEIVVHHAFCVRSVLERLGGRPDAFPLDGEDWFTLNDERTMQWSAIGALLESLQAQLAAQLAARLAHPTPYGQSADEQMDLVLGITCHAIYHAGQIQLIKVLVG